eukprot:2718546-Rhodomonas_salina.1
MYPGTKPTSRYYPGTLVPWYPGCGKDNIRVACIALKAQLYQIWETRIPPSLCAAVPLAGGTRVPLGAFRVWGFGKVVFRAEAMPKAGTGTPGTRVPGVPGYPTRYPDVPKPLTEPLNATPSSTNRYYKGPGAVPGYPGNSHGTTQYRGLGTRYPGP